MPEVLEPLGLRARAPPTESVDGVVEPLRGSVLEEPGRFREDGSDRWKLGVRRMLDVGVLWEPLLSIEKIMVFKGQKKLNTKQLTTTI